MPPQANQRDGRLQIPNVGPQDAGDYICTATSQFGSGESVARLGVDQGKKISLLLFYQLTFVSHSVVLAEVYSC